MHIDVLVGKTTKVVTCQRCGKPISIGELAVYYSTPPKGSAHASCHLRGRGRK
jgi:hypothetical protein